MLTIRLAHSPDADDAFMFYALAKEKIDTNGLRFEHTLKDIETLNREAKTGTYEVTALSFHAYPYLQDRYQLLRCGASFGEDYGPLVVSRRPLAPKGLSHKTIAIPGAWTSAALLLQLAVEAPHTRVIPFGQIPRAVQQGEVKAGVIIHESQLTYAEEGLHPVLDLGKWWHQTTGLPAPLGGNAVRRDLPEPTRRQIARMIHQSIRYGLDHREAALTYALSFGRGLDKRKADRFVGMYVNERTLDFGEEGIRAIETLLNTGKQKTGLPPLASPRTSWLLDA
jgi:1,4-dihydroxy-6-naphthoate synthase